MQGWAIPEELKLGNITEWELEGVWECEWRETEGAIGTRKWSGRGKFWYDRVMVADGRALERKRIKI